MHELLIPQTSRPRFLLGNEAIVRGALESGVGFVASYPGTPSSEIIDRFAQLGDEADIYVEYSVNEKVSVEVCGAAAICGVKSLCAMKHVGLNVAADAFMSLAYVGVKAGMVIVVADDPSLHSSQNEQDSRYYAKLSGVPMLEPSTPQEAYRMTLEAFRISEKFGTPCLLRTTTRINHCRGPVEIGSIPPAKGISGEFKKDPFNLVLIPAVGRKLRLVLLERTQRLLEESEGSPLNFISGKGDLGVITSGVSYLHVLDALIGMGLEDRIRVLKLGFTYPQPKALIAEFLGGVKKALVVEEVEPFIEEAAKICAQESKLSVDIAIKVRDRSPKLSSLIRSRSKTPSVDFSALITPRPTLHQAPSCRKDRPISVPAAPTGRLIIR